MCVFALACVCLYKINKCVCLCVDNIINGKLLCLCYYPLNRHIVFFLFRKENVSALNARNSHRCVSLHITVIDIVPPIQNCAYRIISAHLCMWLCLRLHVYLSESQKKRRFNEKRLVGILRS